MRYYFFEAKQIPVLDADGNIIDYSAPRANAMSVNQADDFRVKTACNELGLSLDPNNRTGFRALVDLINQNRNLQGRGVVLLAPDDVGSATKIRALSNLVKSQSDE